MAWWIYLIFAVLVLIVVGLLCSAFKPLWLVISSPVLFIVWIVRKCKARKAGKYRSDVGKIMKTTDGYFANDPKNKKRRFLVVVDQRKDDGAVAVSKLHENKPGRKHILKGFILKPSKHSALAKDTVIDESIEIQKDRNKTPIMPRDLTDTDDKLTWREKRKLKRRAGGSTRKHRRTTRRKLKRWHNHFRK